MKCSHATKLLSEAEERQLTGRERLRLRFHVFVCTACRRFKKQLGLLRLLLTEASPKILAAVYASDATLSASRRQEIKALLRRAAEES